MRNKLIVPFAFLFAGAAFSDSAYIVSSGITGDGVFGTLDLTSGAYQQFGPTEPAGYYGLATGPNGALYSLNYAGDLDQINQVTGAFTKIGATGLQPCLVPSPGLRPQQCFRPWFSWREAFCYGFR